MHEVARALSSLSVRLTRRSESDKMAVDEDRWPIREVHETSRSLDGSETLPLPFREEYCDEDLEAEAEAGACS